MPVKYVINFCTYKLNLILKTKYRPKIENRQSQIKMTPSQLKTYLNNIVTKKLQISTMIWGAPGIGKSSIVGQIAKFHKIDFIDLRLSQLAPTDLRGLPVAVALSDTANLGV